MSEYELVRLPTSTDETLLQRLFGYLSTNLKVKTSMTSDADGKCRAITRLYLIEPKTGEEKLIAEG
jgi:hypothetical protein